MSALIELGRRLADAMRRLVASLHRAYIAVVRFSLRAQPTPPSGGPPLFDGFSKDDLAYTRQIERVAESAGFTPEPWQVDRLMRRLRDIPTGGTR